MHLDHCKDIEMTRQAVKIAHRYGVTVEGELGIVGVEEDIKVKDRGAVLAEPKQSIKFVEQTGVDIFAPAVGTAHGLYRAKPKIDFERLTKISDTSSPLTRDGEDVSLPVIILRRDKE